MITIKVPATTTNMGPGFDCLGMAFKLYNRLKVEQIEKGLIINNLQNDKRIPCDESNLIYRTMLKFYEEMGIEQPVGGIKLTQDDQIPLTRGLGSSAACIVSGLIAANQLSGGKASTQDICEIAAALEGHPDNSTPAIVGGMVVAALSNKKLSYVKLDTAVFKDLKFAFMIPNFQLSTKTARRVLPKNVSIEDGVFNISRAALLVAALLKGEYSVLEEAMDDRFHQPYRLGSVPEMSDIFKKSKEAGAYGACLSGAGPTLMALYSDDKFIDGMKDYLSGIENNWEIKTLQPDNDGAQIESE